MSKSKCRILVLSSAEHDDVLASQTNADFVAQLNASATNYDIELYRFCDLRMEFATGSLKVFVDATNTELCDFDFVYVKSYFRYYDQVAVIAEYLEASGTPFVCSELKHYLSQTKLTQLARLVRNDFRVPKTVYLPNQLYLADGYQKIVSQLGNPFVFKSIDGHGGDDNFLITDEQHFATVLNSHHTIKFIAQEFIANDSDLRVLIVGKQIKLIIRRKRTSEDTHLNNTSQGANAELVPIESLAPESQKLALKAAELMGRETAGVDVMFELRTGNPYILEVNASPQIATGAFQNEKVQVLHEYFTEVANGID